MKILLWFLLVFVLSTSPMGKSSQLSLNAYPFFQGSSINRNLYETQSVGHSGRTKVIKLLLTEIAMCVIDVLCKKE